VHNVPGIISSRNDGYELTAFAGNNLQQEAFTGLYSVTQNMKNCRDKSLFVDWNKLQTILHIC